MKWYSKTLGEICDEVDGSIRTGPFGSQLHESDYSDQGTPVVMPKDIIEGRVSQVSIARVSDEHVQRLFQHKLKTGDIVYGRRGDIGRQALIKQRESGWLCGTGCLRISIGNSIVDPFYLHYYLRDEKVITKIANQAIGATLPNLNTSILRNVIIRYPSLEYQRRIASILSAYDDLIENNTRRIATLEEMARRVYEEWFVHFRFPGHEKVKMIDSELGNIPEGWAVKTVDETFKILGGGTPSKKEASYWDDGTINWYSPTDLTRSGRTFMESSAEKITGLGLAKSSAKLFPPFSIMMTSRATIGVIAINTNAASTNQGFITCIPNDKFPIYLLFHWLKQNVSIFESLGTGATFKEIIKGVFRQIKLPIPSEKIVDMFQQTVSPMMEQILCFERKNANLRSTRDFLLPKLISGEIDVSKLPESEEAAV